MAGRQNRQNSSSSSAANSAKATRLIASAAAATPDEVLHLLETCQLTEQDADDLLKDAYALNRLLRAHLAHVESPQELRSSQPLRRHGDDQSETGCDDAAVDPGVSNSSSSSAKGFGRQQLSGPERRQQSSSRRSVSLSGRSSVKSAGSSQQQPQAQRLPPIRTCSPGQKLSEMARVYNSGVIQPAHRAGSGNASATAAAAAASTTKKRL